MKASAVDDSTKVLVPPVLPSGTVVERPDEESSDDRDQGAPGECWPRARTYRAWPKRLPRPTVPGANALTALGALAVVALVAVVGLLVPAAGHQFALSFARQPTGFTELRFTTPDALPKSATAGAPIVADFTVVDHETGRRTYAYLVTLTGTGITPVTVRGWLAADPGKAVRRVVVLDRTGTTLAHTVTVTLPGRREAIRYLVAATRRTTPQGAR
jgi:hypothetical protein